MQAQRQVPAPQQKSPENRKRALKTAKEAQLQSPTNTRARQVAEAQQAQAAATRMAEQVCVCVCVCMCVCVPVCVCLYMYVVCEGAGGIRRTPQRARGRCGVDAEAGAAAAYSLPRPERYLNPKP